MRSAMVDRTWNPLGQWYKGLVARIRFTQIAGKLHVSNYTNNFLPVLLTGITDSLPDRIFVRPKVLGHRVVYDHHFRSFTPCLRY